MPTRPNTTTLSLADRLLLHSINREMEDPNVPTERLLQMLSDLVGLGRRYDYEVRVAPEDDAGLVANFEVASGLRRFDAAQMMTIPRGQTPRAERLLPSDRLATPSVRIRPAAETRARTRADVGSRSAPRSLSR